MHSEIRFPFPQKQIKQLNQHFLKEGRVEIQHKKFKYKSLPIIPYVVIFDLIMHFLNCLKSINHDKCFSESPVTVEVSGCNPERILWMRKISTFKSVQAEFQISLPIHVKVHRRIHKEVWRYLVFTSYYKSEPVAMQSLFKILILVLTTSTFRCTVNNVCPSYEDYYTVRENPNCWYDFAADSNVVSKSKLLTHKHLKKFKFC